MDFRDYATYEHGQFIIGSRRRDNTLSFSNRPKVHQSHVSAMAEAERLASETPGKRFVVARLDSEVMMPPTDLQYFDL